MALAAAAKRCASSALFHRSLSLPDFIPACSYHKKVRVAFSLKPSYVNDLGRVQSLTATYVAGNFLAWLLIRLMLVNSCTCKQTQFAWFVNMVSINMSTLACVRIYG